MIYALGLIKSPGKTGECIGIIQNRHVDGNQVDKSGIVNEFVSQNDLVNKITMFLDNMRIEGGGPSTSAAHAVGNNPVTQPSTGAEVDLRRVVNRQDDDHGQTQNQQ